MDTLGNRITVNIGALLNEAFHWRCSEEDYVYWHQIYDALNDLDSISTEIIFVHKPFGPPKICVSPKGRSR